MGSRFRRSLRAAFFVLLGLEAAYVIPANLVLNTPLAGRLINRRPEKFRIVWSLAVTPCPGVVHLRGIETLGASRAIEWRARIDSLTAWFRVAPLSDRTVDLRQVRAAGIEYAQRPRLARGEPAPEEATDWPVIDGPTIGSGPPAGAAGAQQRRGRPWTVRVDRIRGEVRQIWIGRYRIACRGRVEAAMNLVVRGPLEFPRLDYTQEEGELWTGGERMFDGFRLVARARLAPFVPRGRKAAEVIRALSGTFDLEARQASLRFLEYYLRKAPGLRFDGVGPMSLHLRLDAGRLLPGTRLDRRADRIDVGFLGHRLTGNGAVTAEVTLVDGAPRSRLEAVLEQFQIMQPGHAEPFAEGRGFTLSATSTTLDLADPFADLRLEIDQPGSRIPDLSVYNAYLPRQDRFAIVSGAGTLSYHFVADQNDRSLRGSMTFDMDDLVFRFEKATLQGDVRILTRLRHGDAAERRFDIAGTRIELRHRDPPWKGTVRLPAATLRFSEPMEVKARAELALQDTLPLVLLFDAHRDLARPIERLMTIRDVRGGATLRVGREAVDITDLAIDGHGLRSLAELRIGRRGRSGILYIRFHGISLGVELRPGERRDLKLVRPRHWYEQARAARREPPAP